MPNKKTRRFPIKQKGATLVVVLVILIAMTFLGLGSLSDTNIQLAMVRNSQFQTSAYIAALTEINAQVDQINSNLETDIDQEVFNLVQEDIVNGTRSINPTKLITGVAGVVNEADLPYTTTLALSEPNADVFIPVEGFSISADSSVKWLVMQFDSTATIDNTNTTSNQSQGFRYLSAN